MTCEVKIAVTVPSNALLWLSWARALQSPHVQHIHLERCLRLINYLRSEPSHVADRGYLCWDSGFPGQHSRVRCRTHPHA